MAADKPDRKPAFSAPGKVMWLVTAMVKRSYFCKMCEGLEMTTSAGPIGCNFNLF